MFILAGTTKEKIVTAGVLIAFLLLAWVSIGAVRHGGYNLIIPFLSLLIVIMVMRGIPFGYWLARFIFGGTAIISIGGSINPFAYEDIQAAGGSFSAFVLIAVLVSVVAVFLFYCLGQHAKLRGLKWYSSRGAKRISTESSAINQ